MLRILARIKEALSLNKQIPPFQASDEPTLFPWAGWWGKPSARGRSTAGNAAGSCPWSRLCLSPAVPSRGCLAPDPGWNRGLPTQLSRAGACCHSWHSGSPFSRLCLPPPALNPRAAHPSLPCLPPQTRAAKSSASPSLTHIPKCILKVHLVQKCEQNQHISVRVYSKISLMRSVFLLFKGLNAPQPRHEALLRRGCPVLWDVNP